MVKEYNVITEINGDIVKVFAKDIGYGELSVITNSNGDKSIAQVIRLEDETVSLQVFSGGKGITTGAKVTFLNRFMNIPFSKNILGRIFSGAGEILDNGPSLDTEEKIEIGGPSVNPAKRVIPDKVIRTNIPMIDLSPLELVITESSP